MVTGFKCKGSAIGLFILFSFFQLTGQSNNQEILACGEDQVLIIDSDASNEADLKFVWKWKASESEGLPESHWKYMISTDDCKSVDNNKKILISSSHGGAVLVDRKTKKTLFYTKAPNAHSIEYLPKDRIVVALSTAEGGNSLELYDANRSGIVLYRDSLYSGHGVAWIPGRETLFALGYDDLRAYSLKAWNTNTPSLSLQQTWRLPDTGGHDLTVISDDKLVLTTTRGVWVFDIPAQAFSPFEPLKDVKNVKSVNYNQTSNQLIYTKGEISWWSNHIYFKNPDKRLVLPDFKLYKVRVIVR
jgi:hypothetical protein